MKLHGSGRRVGSVRFINLGVSTMLLTLCRRIGIVRQRARLNITMGPYVSMRKVKGESAGGETLSLTGHIRWLWRISSYLIDVMLFRVYRVWCRLRGDEFLVCDRFFWDKMIKLGDPSSCVYRLLSCATPEPTYSFVLDVDAESGMSRRSQASVAYYEAIRQRYYELADRVEGAIWIAGGSVEDVSAAVDSELGLFSERLNSSQ